jgi:soluble lytic murein transglycosylase-like protein
MRYCFILTGCGLIVSALFGGSPAAQDRQVTSVVRPDKRSGRLVRLVVRESGTSRPVAATLDLRRIIQDESQRYDLDPLLIHSMIQVESGYNPYAISPKGAEGLMQLIPSTARRLGVGNSFNLSDNVRGGARYLRHLLDLFRDERLAVAAYNAGEDAVLRYGGVPPYPETRNYVQLVSAKYDAAKRAYRSAAAPAAGDGAEAPRPIEQFVDEQGRLHIRTR